MKRLSVLFAAAAILSLSVAATAGEGECTASTQECLDKIASHYANSGWAGLEGDYSEEAGTFTVTSVVAHGPAAEAGLKKGDVVYGINGVKFASMGEDDWATSKAERVPGATAKYMIHRGSHEKEVDIVLGTMPEEMLAKKVGGHMMDHAQVASVQ